MIDRPTSAILGLLAALASSGCSASPEDRDHIPGSDPDAIGRHVYTCSDGKAYSVDVFEGGLMVDLSPPNDKPVRLAAFSLDSTYVGAGINVRIAGPEMVIERSDGPALKCRRR